MQFTISITLLALLATASAAAVDTGASIFKRQTGDCGEERSYCGAEFVLCCPGYTCAQAQGNEKGSQGFAECRKNA